MRIISRKHLRDYAAKFPRTKASLRHWELIAGAAEWTSMNDIVRSFPKAKVINDERVRFELEWNVHRMVCSLYFPHHLVFVKFLGTHAEYDAIGDITAVAMF